MILSGTQTAAARAQRLSQLQSLLPDIEFAGKETVTQVDLAAEGLRLPGFPTIIGPFGYTDLRASLNWSLVDLSRCATIWPRNITSPPRNCLRRMLATWLSSR